MKILRVYIILRVCILIYLWVDLIISMIKVGV